MDQVALNLPDAAESAEADNPEYAAFVEKFKPKLTTDDCYTPEPVYEAVADWVANEYGLDRSRFVRPFWPGADYAAQKYAPGEIVVDNPPFSLLAPIIREFTRRDVPFFLFAPALTLFTATDCRPCYFPVAVQVVYENGANVPTSFISSLDHGIAVRVVPELFRIVETANNISQAAKKAPPLPKYAYPDQVMTAAMAQRWCRYGVPFCVGYDEATYTRALDAQRAVGKSIFGGGFLLRERAAAERAAAERVAAERWELSDRERSICGLAPRETDQTRLF